MPGVCPRKDESNQGMEKYAGEVAEGLTRPRRSCNQQSRNEPEGIAFWTFGIRWLQPVVAESKIRDCFSAEGRQRGSNPPRSSGREGIAFLLLRLEGCNQGSAQNGSLIAGRGAPGQGICALRKQWIYAPRKRGSERGKKSGYIYYITYLSYISVTNKEERLIFWLWQCNL